MSQPANATGRDTALPEGLPTDWHARTPEGRRAARVLLPKAPLCREIAAMVGFDAHAPANGFVKDELRLIAEALDDRGVGDVAARPRHKRKDILEEIKARVGIGMASDGLTNLDLCEVARALETGDRSEWP